MKAAWWNALLGFDLVKTISPILNSLRLLFPSINIRKQDEIPCHHPPLKIKALQTTKISKLGVLFLSLTKWKLHLHLITLALFPKQVQSFSVPLVPIKSPQAWFLNHHKKDFIKLNRALVTSHNFPVRKFLSCKLLDRKFLSCKFHDSRLLPGKLHDKKPLSCKLHDSRLLPC